MEVILSTVIGGEITVEVDGGKIVHSLIIKMRNSLKEHFKKIFFEGLDRIKINVYISGDVSSYCDKTGITANRYFRAKTEYTTEFCIDKNYWSLEPVLPVDRKFILFMENSLIQLGGIIEKKLKAAGYNFDGELFKEIVLKSLRGIS